VLYFLFSSHIGMHATVEMVEMVNTIMACGARIC
jgi:hypothetical protein